MYNSHRSDLTRCGFGNRWNRPIATVKLRDELTSIATAVGNLDGDLAEADTADERVEATERDVPGRAGVHR